jgi:succinate-semialdehyde dehydrogenase / glutarate-semialdehyde dehydrogenase
LTNRSPEIKIINIMPLVSRNPFNQKIMMEIPEWDSDKILESVESASISFKKWSKTSFAHRSKLMYNLSLILREKRSNFAELIALEMGMPISQAVGDIEKCAQIAEYYADNAENFLKNEFIDGNPNQFIQYEPMGVLLHISPWNYPFYLALRPIIPAIMAGNTVLLKHASNMPQVAMAIQEIFNMAGFEKGVMTTLLISSKQVQPIIEDKRVSMVTLIGSENAGRKVGAVAGNAIKKTVMELGGNDPFIVLKDADIVEAAKQASLARLRNQGQSCNAAKRFILQKSVVEDFTKQILVHFHNQVFGDPINTATTFGPLASLSSLEEIKAQVEQSLNLGATIITGGHGPNAVLTEEWTNFIESNSTGYFYPPTILTNITKEMAVYKEEVFGPVVPIIIVEDEAEAIKVANDSDLGLGASLWTNDLQKAKRLIPMLQCGMVCVNSMVRSNIKMPFGGVKNSGFGRELGSHGIKEFVNVKSVVITEL